MHMGEHPWWKAPTELSTRRYRQVSVEVLFFTVVAEADCLVGGQGWVAAP